MPVKVLPEAKPSMPARCGSPRIAPPGGRSVLLAIVLASLLTDRGELAGQAADGAAPYLSNEPVVPEKAGKVLRAGSPGGQAIVIDGQLDEAGWARADSIEDLAQLEPENMAPITERTVVRVLYDDRHVYVGIYAHDRDPERITTGLVRRDDFPPTDQLSVGFDPRHDHLTGYVFSTNPNGLQRDFFLFDDVNFDPAYDAVWEVGTRVTGDGWVVEFRIPFSQLRFSAPAEGRMVWGFNVNREIFRKGETGLWVSSPRGARGNVSRWGHLVFDGGLPSPRRVELLPFMLARRSQIADVPGSKQAVDAGLDVRLGVGPSATVAATVNPDYGQVEHDPAVLNHTVFETFFPEKRPFFVEDSRVFIPPYSLFQLFHSRRIGQAPGRLPVPSTDRLVEQPQQTTILGAAKITGKGSGWTYGMLAAVTAREYALVDSISADGVQGDASVTRLERTIEPLTSFAAARAQRDILGGSSNVGALMTAVVREGDADAVTGGLDYNIRWHSNRWQWNGHWAITRAPGPAGMRTGFGGITNFGYFGKHLGFEIGFDHLGRDFRVNDLGFLSNRSDRTSIRGALTLSQPDPQGVFRSISGVVSSGQAWNGDGLVFDRAVGLGGSAQFRNFWNASINLSHAFRVLDDLDTRGGPPIVRPARTGVSLSVGSDSRKTTRAQLDFRGQRDQADGWGMVARSVLSFQPWPALQSSLGAGYEFGRDAAQWITNEDADGDGQTDHVYGTLHRDVLDVTLRTTYAIHRDLTLQLFLQPFVAVGDYSNIRKLARPRSFEFQPVDLSSDPDFNRKSLRGTVVLRWEYVRGSALFVAWNLSTFDGARPGVFRPLADLADAFAAEGTHVWLVKASYWWSP